MTYVQDLTQGRHSDGSKGHNAKYGLEHFLQHLTSLCSWENRVTVWHDL